MFSLILDARIFFLRIGTRPNEHWSLDFMSDALCPEGARGPRLRTLSLLDTCTREPLAIAVDTSLPIQAVTRVLDGILLLRQRPEHITWDSGPELTSPWFDEWADRNGIELVYINPGKPVQNAGYPRVGMESFNVRYRNEYWITNLEDARRSIEAWRIDCNRARPHSSHDYTPEEVHARLIRNFDGSIAAGFS